MIKTVKGIAIENIFNGVDNAGARNIFIEIKSEIKKRITANDMLATKAIFVDEEMIPLTFPFSFFPLKYALFNDNHYYY